MVFDNRTKLLVLILIVLVLAMTPGLALADETSTGGTPTTVPEELAYLIFLSPADQEFVVGSTGSINFKLYNQNAEPFSGSVSGYLTDPLGNIVTTSVSGGAGSYSIPNVTFDQVGTYGLLVRDKNDNYAAGSIIVSNAVITTIGSLIVNSNSTVTVKITDPDGQALARKSVTVDGSAVGANSSTSTTLYDGTFIFTMTPTKLGTVKFVYGGHIIGTMVVQPAYTSGVRIGGQANTNASLSVKVAQNGWTSSETVILTRDDVVADAMVAVPLSKKYDAPILMTSSKDLDADVLDEILNLDADVVYIIGGTGAISADVEQKLINYGLTTVRIAGTDRYDTAAQIAHLVGSPGTVYLAYGYGEADALAASAFAAKQGIPILLTDTNSLPESTSAVLKELAPSNVTILGGTGIISIQLENNLSTEYVVKRWGGADRYGTQQIILQNCLNQPTSLYIASALVSPTDVSSGKPSGDALVTAALAAKKGGFVITVPPDSLPLALDYALLYNKGYISSATVVGNTKSITLNLEQKIQTMLKH